LTPKDASDAAIIQNIKDADFKINQMRASQIYIIALTLLVPLTEYGRKLLYQETWKNYEERVCCCRRKQDDF
jgi:hypothetical protein